MRSTDYLSAVFDLVMWWKAEDRAISRARWALQRQRVDLPTTDEPFAMVILCTADRQKSGQPDAIEVVARAPVRQSTRQTPNRLPPSFSGRAASTNVPPLYQVIRSTNLQ
jgi:hypothetical protein